MKLFQSVYRIIKRFCFVMCACAVVMSLVSRAAAFTVTNTSPSAAALGVAASAAVEGFFDEAVDTNTVTTNTFHLYSGQSGFRYGALTFSNSDCLVHLAPGSTFRPGERIFAEFTKGITNISVETLNHYTWSFRAAVQGGSGVFTTSGLSGLGSADSWGVALGDLNGNGHLDAFVANFGVQPNQVWTNDGTGVFSTNGLAGLGLAYSADVALGDLNGNGYLDAFVVNGVNQPNQVWTNDGTGVFSTNGLAGLGLAYSADVALGDLNGNGYLDAFVVNGVNQPNQVWTNDGTGIFSTNGLAGLSSDDSRMVALGDLNGNGYLDAFVANTNQPNQVWTNDGTGVFSTNGLAGLGSGPSYGVALGDLNGNGYLDAFVANTNQPNQVWTNDGTGVFSTNGLAGLGSAYSIGVALGDLNGNGSLDAFVANHSESNTVWLNQSAPIAPLGVIASDGTYTAKVDLVWGSVVGATGYSVWRNLSNDTGSASSIGTSAITNFNDTGVSPGIVYFYWIKSTNSLGVSDFSAWDSGYAALAYGAITIDVTPSNGTWVITSCPAEYSGATNGSGDLVNQSAPVGSYTVEFGPLQYYTAPSAATGIVQENTTATLSGTYTILDSDSDGLTDSDEVNVYGTDPYNPDTDGDRYNDGYEVSNNSDPLDPNSYPKGVLSISSPTATTIGKIGKTLTISWTGSSALGTANIWLASGTNLWDLATGLSCSDASMSSSVQLPSGINPATNYHVQVIGTGSVNEFGDSDMFTIIRECHGDYDGDGKADLCLYYPPRGMWFVLRSTKGYWYQQFGWDGPTPIPADYDGDGLTDLAVYYPASGTWYILTWAPEFYTLQFGWNETDPVPADYDGDGRMDFAVYYPDQGTWYIFTWDGQYSSVQFGWSETIPVPGDYDGDGTSDVAVYYEAGGIWYLRMSTDGVSSRTLGGPGMTAVPDDYDGDGTTDLAVYKPENGTWYFKMSSEGDSSVQFGWSESIPMSGDYDGDGKADLGLVYGPMGMWYLLMSTEGYWTGQFGWDGPIPLD